MKSALICGAGGFIGSHLVEELKAQGYWIRGTDLKRPEFSESPADDFVLCDLRNEQQVLGLFDRHFDEVYQLAADMGGAGFVFTGENDADIMYNSVMINLNVLNAVRSKGAGRVFYASSACIYPEANQLSSENPICNEDSAYPAAPDSEYGWEKLFSERLYLAFMRNHGIPCRIARYHNIFGPKGTWEGGREKAPAAICRKVAMAKDGQAIEIWGDGEQTRSFLFVDECIEGTLNLMRSDCKEPLNIGSEEMFSINELAKIVISISEKEVALHHVKGPTGVRGRTSDNCLIRKRLGWAPSAPLRSGLERTYAWIEEQVREETSVRQNDNAAHL